MEINYKKVTKKEMIDRINEIGVKVNKIEKKINEIVEVVSILKEKE